MARVKLESIYKEKPNKLDVATPIASMFNKIRNYTSPLLSHELLRKRKRVKNRTK
jgi:hypothetical protein